MPDRPRGVTASWATLHRQLGLAELALQRGHATTALHGAVGVRTADAATPALRWSARHLEGLALEASGDLERAVAVLREVVDRVPSASMIDDVSGADDGRRDWIAAATALSRCLRRSGLHREAAEVGDRADRHIAGWGLEQSTEAVRLVVTVASAHYERGDLNHATRLCLAALDAADAGNTAEGRAAALWNIGMLESARGRPALALLLLQEALGLMEGSGDGRDAGRLRTQVGWLLLRQDPPRPHEALTLLELAAEEIRHSSAGPLDEAVTLLPHVHALLELGRLDEAAVVVRSLLHVVDELVATVTVDAHVELLAEAHLLAAEVASAQQHLPERWAHLRQARQWASRSARTPVSTGPDGSAATPGNRGDRSLGELWVAVAAVSERFGDLVGALAAHRTASHLLGRGHALSRPTYRAK